MKIRIKKWNTSRRRRRRRHIVSNLNPDEDINAFCMHERRPLLLAWSQAVVR